LRFAIDDFFEKMFGLLRNFTQQKSPAEAELFTFIIILQKII